MPEVREAPGAPPEAVIVSLLVDQLPLIFKGIRAASCEVRSHGRARADVAFALANDQLGIIEAKRHDWRRAIAQAHLNTVCCDIAFVGLWHSAVTTELLEEAAAFGIGVISVARHSSSVCLFPRPGRPESTVRDRIMCALEPVVQ